MPVEFHPEVESELAESAAWYEAHGSGLAADFLRAFDVTVSSIERNPLAYQKVYKNIRRALLRRFPYVVIYVHAKGITRVLACVHGRRNPKRWKARASE